MNDKYTNIPSQGKDQCEIFTENIPLFSRNLNGAIKEGNQIKFLQKLCWLFKKKSKKRKRKYVQLRSDESNQKQKNKVFVSYKMYQIEETLTIGRDFNTNKRRLATCKYNLVLLANGNYYSFLDDVDNDI